jgi:hypothetical protein
VPASAMAPREGTGRQGASVRVAPASSVGPQRVVESTPCTARGRRTASARRRGPGPGGCPPSDVLACPRGGGRPRCGPLRSAPGCSISCDRRGRPRSSYAGPHEEDPGNGPEDDGVPYAIA